MNVFDPRQGSNLPIVTYCIQTLGKITPRTPPTVVINRFLTVITHNLWHLTPKIVFRVSTARRR